LDVSLTMADETMATVAVVTAAAAARGGVDKQQRRGDNGAMACGRSGESSYLLIISLQTAGARR
jgi:hypothetical protein